MTLNHSAESRVLVAKLQEADTYMSRLVGLLNRSSLEEQEGLLFRRCNSIHTFGMRFAIDCLFLDSKMQVKKIVSNVRPWRIVGPVWGATAVVEFRSGVLQKMNLKMGDQLHVGN